MPAGSRDPHSPEAVADVLDYMRSMTAAEWQSWIDKLSRAPEGVYDPYSDENWPMEREFRYPTNGQAPGAREPDAAPSPATPTSG